MTSDSPDTFSAEDLYSLAAQMRRMWQAMVRAMHPTGAHENAHPQQYWVMGLLRTGSRRMSDLAEAAQTSQASLTGIVDRLEERGLVMRSRSHEDRRVVEVSLTQAGEDEIRTVRARFVEGLEHVLEPLTPAERRQLLSLITTIAEHQPRHSETC